MKGGVIMKRFRRVTAIFVSMLVFFGSAVGVVAADETIQAQLSDSVQTTIQNK